MSRILFEQVLNSNELQDNEGINMLIKMVHNQNDFDQLFACFKSKSRLVIERSAEAIERITQQHPEYLLKHKATILNYLQIAQNRAVKWHLSLLLTRLQLDNLEFRDMYALLEEWTRNKNESKLYRVYALQSLFDLSWQHSKSFEHLMLLLDVLEQEDIASLNARIRVLRSKLVSNA